MERQIISEFSESQNSLIQNYDSRFSDIVSRPHMVFANDFIYSFCREFQVNWLPLGYQQYEIHPRSPVTTEVRQAALIVLKNNIREYERISEETLPDDMDRLQTFSDYIRNNFHRFKQSCYLSIRDVFLKLVFVARLSILLYKQGTTLAPSVCSIILTEVMGDLNNKCAGLIFHLFAVFATGVIEGDGYQSLSKENLKLSL